MQAMENKFWSITTYGTTINVNKGYIADADGKVNVVVLGANQQRMLVNSNDWLDSEVGDCSYNAKHGLWIKSNDADSASDDDTVKLFKYDDKFAGNINYDDIGRNGHKVFFKTTTKSIMVTEPCIRYKQGRFLYSVDRPDHKYEDIILGVIDKPDREPGKMFESMLFANDNAIKEAEKDLDMCYYKVLQKLADDLSEQKEKSIALSTLGTDVGFERKKVGEIAVDAVLTFIKNNMRTYDRIEFFVKKRSEFALYKELLEKGCKLPGLVLLLYCAREDKKSEFTVFPPELIDLIIQRRYALYIHDIDELQGVLSTLKDLI
jgi:hypothetical protein